MEGFNYDPELSSEIKLRFRTGDYSVVGGTNETMASAITREADSTTVDFDLLMAEAREIVIRHGDFRIFVRADNSEDLDDYHRVDIEYKYRSPRWDEYHRIESVRV
jgi:hypothetical protein